MTAIALVPITIASALTCGGVLALTATLRQPLTQRLGLSPTQANGLLGGMQLVLVPLFPLAGALLDTVGVEHGLIGGAVLAAMGLSVLALRDGFATALTALFLVGAAAATLFTATTMLLPATFFRDAAGKPTAAVCLGYAIIGLGAVLVPLAAEWLLQSLRWRRGLLLLALFSLAPALFAALTPASEFPAIERHPATRAFHSSLIWVAGLVGFLYLPIEMAVTQFIGESLPSLGYTKRQAGWLWIGFWASFLSARLLAMMFVLWETIRPGKEGWFLVGLGLSAAVALGNLTGAARKSSLTWGLLLVAFFCGPIYPALVGVVLEHFREEAGTAVGVLAGLGTLGSLLLGPLMAYDARRSTAQRALRIPLVTALLLAAAALVLGLTA